MARDAALPITVRHVTKTYGKVHALDDVDLDVRSGEFLTLLGPSGSGKTTLLMVLAGFTRPDHGSLKFGDREVIRLAPHKRDVGMVFQSYALFPHMDVAANIAYPLKLRGIAKTEIAARTERALETVKLGGYGTRRIDELSGGQRQRVALARAIVFEPRILLMDEPLSALDKQLREHMQIELRQLHDRLGMTTVYVTHDQREALTMSDRIAVINHGRIMQLDAPRRIYEAPANRFVAQFIGESHLLPVEVRNGACSFGGTPIRLRAAPAADGRHLLMIRPERLRILDARGAGDATVLKGRAVDVIYQGDSFVLHAALADGTTVSVRGISTGAALAAMPERGREVALGLDAGDAYLLPDEG
jgi:putative spermidine/putrescine transport system ATP-binding protein